MFSALLLMLKTRQGFTPEKIVKWDSKELKDLQHYSNHDADTVGNPSPASVEPPAPSRKSRQMKTFLHSHKEPQMKRQTKRKFLKAKDGVKEAFGFGKDEEEEESEEPKTQEFTVVLQEGDKLELTDITEEETRTTAC